MNTIHEFLGIKYPQLVNMPLKSIRIFLNYNSIIFSSAWKKIPLICMIWSRLFSAYFMKPEFKKKHFILIVICLFIVKWNK